RAASLSTRRAHMRSRGAARRSSRASTARSRTWSGCRCARSRARSPRPSFLLDDVAGRTAAVRVAVADAARRVARDLGEVRIVGVTKTFPPAAVRAALLAGIRDIGENYVQEASAKRAAAGGTATWHLIGGLQRNKVRAAVATFDWVHTVDSLPLAAAPDAEATRAGRRLM